ncbi:MAG: two-component system, OmpR family, sensor histidine kinase MprB [Acidimicrobiaceae bacterium]|nr:two-component system, OmpR family, sensor histidine kinase MprB [Acidimicrobiaceae bacterium]
MTLRARVAIAVAVIVAAAIATAGLVSYQGSRTLLRQQVDQFLDARSQRYTRTAVTLDQLQFLAANNGQQRFAFADLDAITQILDRAGAIAPSAVGQPRLPVSAADAAVATSGRPKTRRDVYANGQHYRMLTIGLSGGGAVQIARNLDEIDTVLSRLRTRLLLVIVIGTALAALLALFFARRTARPIERLRDAAQRVITSGDLTSPIEATATGGREVGQLTATFNSMLAALAQAREQQARLVADASHELRTPLTAVRTNIEFLERATTLGEADRQTLLAETRIELAELTDLVTEMVELATETRTVEPVVDVDLPEVVSDVAERSRRRSGRQITVALGRPARVRGQQGLLERAVANLVDNALKFSDAPAPVEITIDGAAVEVADRGIGIAPEDRTKVFNRFYRADSARTKAGSGLGLSIVAHIAEAHGATVTLRARPGGGTIARFELPDD